MRTKLTCATTLLATAGTAVAITAAQTAGASPLPKICLPTDTATTCHTSSNGRTAEAVPAVSLLPFGTMSRRLGGH
jgi:hypothetical protein